MEILRRLFRSPKPAVEIVYLSLEDETITPEEYLKAWERIMATADGRTLANMFRNQLLSALSNTCPPDVKDPQTRSQWLAAHDAIISARRDILSHAIHNIQLIKRTDTGTKLPPVGKRGR